MNVAETCDEIGGVLGTYPTSAVVVVYVALMRIAFSPANAISKCSLSAAWPSSLCQYCSNNGTDTVSNVFGCNGLSRL